MPPCYRTEMTQAMGSLSKHSPCLICCGRSKTLNIRHVHTSTTFYNKEMSKNGENFPYCYFCDYPHPIDNWTRQRVILSTSTLNGVQYLEGWDKVDVPFHIDMETVAGATIPTLKKCWERSYMTNPLPIDTLLVAGLNDITRLVSTYTGPAGDINAMAEYVSEGIMSRIRPLYALSLEHHCRHNVMNTFAVATILRVPAMYWSELDGELPSPDYINLREVVDRTNLKISEFNLSIGSPTAPKIHLAGTRKGKGGRVYMFKAFREDNKAEMMHLKDHHRFKLMAVLFKYFKLLRVRPIAVQISAE